MARRRPPVVAGEITFTPGAPYVHRTAPRARSLSSAFLLKGQEHFEAGGYDIWQTMHDKFPIEYFWGLITLAKVLKIESGQPGAFDRPASREEALERLEATAGSKARHMLEQFLEKIGEAEQAYIEEQGERG